MVSDIFPPYPCQNCGSGNLYKTYGDADQVSIRYHDGSTFRTSTYTYSDILGWKCRDCKHWFPDHDDVDETGAPTRNDRERRKPMTPVEKLYRQFKSKDATCRYCSNLGIESIDPFRVCAKCNGEGSAPQRQRFTIKMIMLYVKELEKRVTDSLKKPAGDAKMYYYGVLGLKPGAAKKDIKKAFKRMSKAFHPDNQDTGDTEMFKLINAAKEMLLK